MNTVIPYLITFAAGAVFGMAAARQLLKGRIEAEGWQSGFFGRQQWECFRREKDGKFKSKTK